MAKIEKSTSIMIRQSLAQVFNFVSNPKNFKLWQPFVVDAEITSRGQMTVGTTYRYSFQAMGNVVETTGEITEYLPFSSYSYRTTSSPFPIKGGFSFEEVDEFVKVTAFGEAEPGGYFSMAKSMISLMLGRQLRMMLQNLKEILEDKS